MTIKERIQAPTPPFFKKLRNLSLILAAISGSLMAAPVALPAILIKAAGFLAVGATVSSAVSQTATMADNTEDNELPDGQQH